MGVTANTVQSYSSTTLKDDVQEALISISPTDTPFMSAIGTRNVDNTLFEWGEVTLTTAVANNSVIEGESSPGNDAATLPKRLSNYTNLSDKVVEISSTAEACDGVGDAESMAKQVAYKLKELKRDMETMMLNNAAGNAGASGTARVTAGLPAFIRTNASRGTGGAAPTLSGTTAGFPNAAATDSSDGNKRAITETILKGVVADIWEAGGDPSIVLCGASNKQTISGFSGINTQYADVEKRTSYQAIDFLVTDFGTLKVIPSRHVRARDVHIVSPDYARVAYLQTASQKPLAETGHSKRTLISVEFGLQIDSETAHGTVADCTSS